MKRNYIPWSEKENDILKENYNYYTYKDLQKKFFPNRTVESISSQCRKLGLKKDIRTSRGWTQQCIDIMKEKYPFYSNKLMHELYLPQFTAKQIAEFGSKCLNLKKNKNYIKNWTSKDINTLKEKYSTSTIDELNQLIPNKSKNQIRTMANRLGLRKTPEQCKIISTMNLEKSIICSKPQQKINDLLDSMQIEYEREYFINYYHVDLFLPLYNLMIEVQGDYWHMSPLLGKDCVFKDNLAKSKDKSKHSYIKNHYNIETLYLWETDINKDIDKCKALIQQYIDSQGILSNYHSFNYSYDNSSLQLIPNTYEMDY